MKLLRTMYIIWYREILRIWRDKLRLLGSFVFPMLFFVMLGGGLTGSMRMLSPGVSYTQYMFPGVIAMTVLMTSLMSGLGLVWDREFGFLKEVLVAPVSRSGIVLGKIAGGATVGGGQGLIMLVLAPLIGIKLNAMMVALLFFMLLLSAFALGGVGVLVASRMRSIEAFGGVMQLIIWPMIFLSGIFFPVSNLPSWMNILVKINPVSYIVDSIRQVILIPEETASLPPGVSGLQLSLFGHPFSLLEEAAITAFFGFIVYSLALLSFNRVE